MKVSDVTQRVAAIEAISGDDEAAHSAEDDLYYAVLKAIADGTNAADPVLLAAAAIKTKDLTFARWCA